MPYSIPSSTKTLAFTAPFLFYFTWCPVYLRICYGARSVHFTVPPRKKRYTLLPTQSAARLSTTFKPLSVTVLLWQGHC